MRNISGRGDRPEEQRAGRGFAGGWAAAGQFCTPAPGAGVAGPDALPDQAGKDRAAREAPGDKRAAMVADTREQAKAARNGRTRPAPVVCATTTRPAGSPKQCAKGKCDGELGQADERAGLRISHSAVRNASSTGHAPVLWRRLNRCTRRGNGLPRSSASLKPNPMPARSIASKRLNHRGCRTKRSEALDPFGVSRWLVKPGSAAGP